MPHSHTRDFISEGKRSREVERDAAPWKRKKEESIVIRKPQSDVQVSPPQPVQGLALVWDFRAVYQTCSED